MKINVTLNLPVVLYDYCSHSCPFLVVHEDYADTDECILFHEKLNIHPTMPPKRCEACLGAEVEE